MTTGIGYVPRLWEGPEWRAVALQKTVQAPDLCEQQTPEEGFQLSSVEAILVEDRGVIGQVLGFQSGEHTEG